MNVSFYSVGASNYYCGAFGVMEVVNHCPPDSESSISIAPMTGRQRQELANQLKSDGMMPDEIVEFLGVGA